MKKQLYHVNGVLRIVVCPTAKGGPVIVAWTHPPNVDNKQAPPLRIVKRLIISDTAQAAKDMHEYIRASKRALSGGTSSTDPAWLLFSTNILREGAYYPGPTPWGPHHAPNR